MVAKTYKHVSKLLGGTALVLAGNVLGMGSQFGIRIVSANYLGPEQYGLIAMGLTTVNILVIFSLLGLKKGLARHIPRSDKYRELLVSSLLISLPFATMLALLISFNSAQIEQFFNLPGLSGVLTVMALAVPFVVFLKIVIGVFQGFESAKERVILENISNKTLQLIFIAGAVLFGLDTVGVAGAWLGAVTIAAVVSLVMLWWKADLIKSGNSFVPVPSFSSTAYPLLVFSLPLMISQSLWQILQNIDNFLLGYFYTSTQVGTYDAVFVLSRIVLVIPMSFTFMYLPIYSDIDSSGNSQLLIQFYQVTTKWMMFATLPIYLLFLTQPSEVLDLVYGQDYATGSIVMMALISGFLFHVIMGLNGVSLTAIGKTRIVMYGNITAFSLNFILNFVLIPPFGLIGAAVASAVSFGLINIILCQRLYVYTGAHPLSREMLGPLSGMLLITPIMFYFKSYFDSDILSLVILFLIILLSEVIAIKYLGGVTSEDKKIAQQFYDKIPINKWLGRQ